MTRREIRSWLMDMDGVLMREEHLIPGADHFYTTARDALFRRIEDWLQASGSSGSGVAPGGGTPPPERM